MTTQILIAGFGGQGVLFAGKFLAYKGLLEEKQVSWLPSYGPEMRGGTANCSIILSDDPVGSPIVSTPDALIAMNLPSYDKYEPTVIPGGKIFVDSTLIGRKANRDDVDISIKVLKDNKVTVKDTVTKGDMDALTAETYPKLTFTAYACQYMKNNDEAFKPIEAWNNVYKPATP